MLRVLMTKARESLAISARFSTSNTGTPYRDSVIPATMPAGPAPAIITGARPASPCHMASNVAAAPHVRQGGPGVPALPHT
jgi:hypothetical protein